MNGGFHQNRFFVVTPIYLIDRPTHDIALVVYHRIVGQAIVVK
jgi:hypothetical protein